MASSSGNSTTSMQIQNSVNLVDDKKRKRMASNRESARRSRMRKQKHVDDLISEIENLKRENSQILQTINLNSQQFLNIKAENSVLNAQINELSQRLMSLNEICNSINTLKGNNGVGMTSYVDEEGSLDILGGFGFADKGYIGNFGTNDIFINNPWNLGYLNQPIMASVDVLQH